MNRKTKVRIYNAIVITLLVAGIAYVVSKFVHLGDVEFTDNAYVHQHITPVNARVQGFVEEIRFEEYQPVKKGDTLMLIEDTQLKLRVVQAEADLANARAAMAASNTSIASTHSAVAATDAAIAEAKAQLENATVEEQRYSSLLAKKAVTQQQYDQVHTAYLAAKARHQQLVDTRKSTALVSSEKTQRLEQNEAAIKLAEANLDLAKLNLSYSVVLAPCDGVMGRKDINVGQLVQPGQPLVDIIDSSQKWIVANYREKQLRNIQVGMPVEIKIDAFNGIMLHGVVQSISDATGSAVSTIPTDNATGNFVKVEQRVPVKIEFTPADSSYVTLLRAGMSAECEVKY